MAYDSGCIMFRNNDNSRNFDSTVDDIIKEKTFQNKYSQHDVLEMIKNGSYALKFANFRSEYQRQILNSNLIVIHDGEYHARELLFKKVLTSSDVGRLSRLVIPKRYALRHFPVIDVHARIEDCVFHIDVYDAQKNLWTFRYCFWKSTRSYVFTSGWNKFVKGNQLKAGDTVSFYKNHSGDGSFYGIQVLAGVRNIAGSVTQNLYNPEEVMNDEVVRVKEENELSITSSNLKAKDFMLFGVRIKIPSILSQGERSNDIIKEDGDYLVQNANYQKVKAEEEEFDGLKLDLNLPL